ncbi:hypothetical protein [Streptomyces sp. NPDC052701]|uniref:hypothetical protein n=1 Tax=Streptomyces sp. NPDC052701 TaxID=3155533 RepID=UPI00342E07FA
MATAGVHRPGAVLGVILAAGGLIGGCGPAGTGREAPATPARSAPAAPAAPPQDLCARLVTHWSRKTLDQDTYGDYQSMGLSGGQYEILRAVVDAARAEERRHGARAADELLVRRAREACADRYRTGAPGGDPWR